MTQELADAEEARESVFEFRTELRRGNAAEPEQGPALRVYLELDGHVLPSQLAWTAVDGAHSAIAFRNGTAEFTGVHRAADGTTARFEGRLASRRAYPSLPAGVQPGDVLAFDTHEEDGGAARDERAQQDAHEQQDEQREAEGSQQQDPQPQDSQQQNGQQDAQSDRSSREDGWRRAGRLRLLLDDGRAVPLRDLQWRDARGVTAAVSFSPDRSGFLGYLIRPDQAPVGLRGFAVPGRTVPSGEDLMAELEEFGREALGMAQDLLGRIGGWLGGGGNGGGGNGPRPA
jgi:hypothetical protein